MTTTTLRLPSEVKARIDKLAAAEGKSAHAFMVEELTESVARIERRRAFIAEAARRLKHMERTGEHYTLDDVKRYAQELARGDKPALPPPRVNARSAARKRKAT